MGRQDNPNEGDSIMTDYKHALRPRLIAGKWSIQGTAPLLGRVRKQYPTKDIAELESQKMITQVGNHLAGSQIRETLLTKAQEKDASLALQIMQTDPKLQGFGSLLEIVNFAKSRSNGIQNNVTLLEAGNTYINDLTARGRDESYLTQVRNKLIRLQNFFDEEMLVQDFTKDMIRAWIRGDNRDCSPFSGKEVTKTTKTAELTFLKGFFNFCRGQDWIDFSPCEGVKSYGKEKAEIKALSLEETQLILDIAKAHSDEAYAYFALSLFAGLRPEELRPSDGDAQVMWEDFTFRTKGASTLEVGYRVGKVTSRRVVELPGNLVSILSSIRKDSGAVIESSYATWRGIKDYIRAKAGYKVYGQHFKHIDPDLAKVSNRADRPKYVRDVLRHSAITYRLEIEQNKDAVANWAGNSPAVIDQHYRALVKGTRDLDPNRYALAYFELR